MSLTHTDAALDLGPPEPRPDFSPSSDEQRRTIAYYVDTERTFQNWAGGVPASMHYGYHDTRTRTHAGALVRMKEVLAELAGVRPGDRVLDAGCGEGASTLWLARERGACAHGVSIVPHQIQTARRAAASLPRVSFAVEDYCRTSAADASKDLVWAVESVCHTACKRRFFEEAARVLAPGGRLLLADYFLEPAPLDETERFVVDRWVDGWAIARPPTLAEVAVQLRALGFDFEARDLTHAIAPSSLEMEERGRRGLPDDLFEKRKNARQMRHVEGCIYQGAALRLGLWRYLAVVARLDAAA